MNAVLPRPVRLDAGTAAQSLCDQDEMGLARANAIRTQRQTDDFTRGSPSGGTRCAPDPGPGCFIRDNESDSPMTTSPPRRPHPVTVQQAAEDSPTLARLAQLARESGEQLKAVESLIPVSLRPAVRPGPLDGESWCLLVDSNAAAAKLRQLLPALLARLRHRGSQVTAIRIKVQTPSQRAGR